MLTAFIMIVMGMLIIWFFEKYSEIMLHLWIKMGMKLFQFTVFHSDDDTGNCYGLTFTDDEHWEKKCLKDLNERLQDSEESQ
ncbi:MAG: hypothetical protein NTZ24_13495 [Deltaproteobacteria bacterium]|nr:hypothetical protein [Deltaproteobacteria bacterium]